jgi:salicylate hydroxylase
VAATRTVLIAGAGIGGLTAALALAAKGFRVVILEMAQRLEEAGAGLQLSPNASRILIELGLEQRLMNCAVTPDAVSIASARSGGEIARLPLGESANPRSGAPYWVLHRADLQAALQARVEETSKIELRLGWQFENAVMYADGVTVTARSGGTRQQEQALALIGADGVWSAVRQRLFPRIQPQFSGLVAWRGTFEAARLPGEVASSRVQLWMGRNAHLVAYPISAGRSINLVAIMPEAFDRPGWSAPGDPTEINSRFTQARWPAPARNMIGAVDEWRKWPLFTVPDSGPWSAGATTLLGDAAHAMLPFAAQGAAMAIEDAAVLAKCLAGTADSAIPSALQRYAGLRRARVARVQRLAQVNGKIYHLGSLAALARDVFIRRLGAERIMARQHWIYDWRA